MTRACLSCQINITLPVYLMRISSFSCTLWQSTFFGCVEMEFGRKRKEEKCLRQVIKATLDGLQGLTLVIDMTESELAVRCTPLLVQAPHHDIHRPRCVDLVGRSSSLHFPLCPLLHPQLHVLWRLGPGLMGGQGMGGRPALSTAGGQHFATGTSI